MINKGEKYYGQIFRQNNTSATHNSNWYHNKSFDKFTQREINKKEKKSQEEKTKR